MGRWKAEVHEIFILNTVGDFGTQSASRHDKTCSQPEYIEPNIPLSLVVGSRVAYLARPTYVSGGIWVTLDTPCADSRDSEVPLYIMIRRPSDIVLLSVDLSVPFAWSGTMSYPSRQLPSLPTTTTQSHISYSPKHLLICHTNVTGPI
jgi:hypothetical protein